MAISHAEVLAMLSPEERAEVQIRAKELIEEYTTLTDLRSAHQLTQAHLAKRLGVAQDSVSRMERRADMLLSTMSSYVEAMGGKLRLVAEFPNRKPYFLKLSDLPLEAPSPRRRKPAPAKTEKPVRKRQKTA
jgi:transcriptional regulator with XRE-family HTH domain